MSGILHWTGREGASGFRLTQMRGRGSFGSVWEAVNDAGEERALKILPCNDSLSAAKEIRALQAIQPLRHPNLIRIEKVWCEAGQLVVSMELADGSLLDLLDAYQSEYGTTLPGDEACSYLTQAARALDYLNSRQHWLDGRKVGFQHCDVKPSNLLVTGDVVKVADLGLAVALPAPITAHAWAGTPDFTAPEVFQGRLTDWSDQYALAVTYCQLRGGRLPFPAVPQYVSRGYTRPAPDLSMLTERERPVIARALAPVAPHRWATCGEMMAQLSAALAPDKPVRSRGSFAGVARP